MTRVRNQIILLFYSW